MNTPIVFIIFNRPETTSRVFESIKNAKPKTIYVIADGPRKNNPNDKQKCKETRAILKHIDWKCKVYKDFSKINLGCKKRIVSGLDNAFKLFDRAIILEDDCLPNQSFFNFCETMLDKYRNNEKIYSITGDNFLFEKQDLISDSYYFSAYPNIWGWATWKRVWKKYDPNITSWPLVKKSGKYDKTFKKPFEQVYLNKINTWDIQFAYYCLINKGLTIVPNKNLVSNIGFGQKSTHTNIKTIVSNMNTYDLPIPHTHPNKITINHKADKISRFHFTKLGIIVDFIKQSLKHD